MPEAGVVRAGDSVMALVARKTGYRDLYYDWEQSQWEAAALELDADAVAWEGLDPRLRRWVADSLAWRALRAETAVSTLVPFVDAAPLEEQGVVLTTQLADEARNLVFFQRYRADVIQQRPSDPATEAGIVPLDHLLGSLLPDAAARVSSGADHALVTGVVEHHLGVLALLALPEADELISLLRGAGELPGLERALDLESGALVRHVAFGLRFVGDATAGSSVAEEAARKAFDRVRPAAVAALGELRRVGGADPPDRSDDLKVEKEPAAWFQAAGLGFLVQS